MCFVLINLQKNNQKEIKQIDFRFKAMFSSVRFKTNTKLFLWQTQANDMSFSWKMSNNFKGRRNWR